MWNLRCGIYVSLVLIASGVVGCNKAAPPPAASAAPAVGGPVAPPANPQGVPAPAVGAAAGGTAAGATPVDAQIQQRVLALKAKLPSATDAQGSLTRTDMKQVGLAFHNYHDTFNGFPATDGAGADGKPKSGLSWRVLLLPLLDEAPLYNEFHLDEPWDSEHNKTLITRMPKVFGSNPEGKTRLHVLTGNGAPFVSGKLLSMSEIEDGTSNTILAVVGGPDTAEVWTKPGGREFDPKAPLKSLGNVGDTFQVVMMDGSAVAFKKTIAPELLSVLIQSKDHTTYDSEQYEAARVGAGPATEIKINNPVAPTAPPATKVELSFIPADAFLAMTVHPRRVYNHPVVKSVREQIPADMQNSTSESMPWEMKNGIQQFQSLRTSMGIALENVDQFTVVLDPSLPAAMKNNPFSLPPFGVIVRNSAPFDVDGIVARFTKSPVGCKIEEHEGIAMLLEPIPSQRPAPALQPPPPVFPGDSKPVEPGDVQPDGFNSKKAATPDDPCQVDKDGAPASAPDIGSEPADPAPTHLTVAFVNDSVMLIGTDAVVKKMITARNSTTATTELTKQVEALGSTMFALALDGTPLKSPLKTLFKDAPLQVTLFAPFALGVKGLNLTWDLDAKDFLNLSARFQTADMAAGLFGMLDVQFKGLKDQYPAMKDGLGQDPSQQQVMAYADQIVQGATLSNNGDTLSFVIPQLKDLDKLPVALKPAIDAANNAHQQQVRKNKLKMLGIAFFNYESTFRHWPALNGPGAKNGPNPGLSWRVYLLPYLDESSLYSQFKLDEPWDSPTNKALIRKMPKVYGSNPDGKSNIHVLTGNGAPFQNDKGISFQDIKDGSSNTILAVEAGEDTAEIWTKPVGMTFDSKGPLKCLGSAKDEFMALLFDGSVRLMKGMDAENFSRAVQHADKKPVEFP